MSKNKSLQNQKQLYIINMRCNIRDISFNKNIYVS